MAAKVVVLLSVLVSACQYAVQGQWQCANQNLCVPLSQCPHLTALLSKPMRTQKEIETLRAAHCGYEGRTPKVCCINPPTATSKSCATPDGQIGECVSLYSCQHLVQMLSASPLSLMDREFIHNSRCEGPDDRSVCCGPGPPAALVTPLTSNECEITAAPPDPRTECCGRDATSGNKITGGNDTTVDQYPWLVIIEYRKQSIKLLCGGALISARYVLTAGHCVTGPVLNYGTPVNIRLGEYDTSHEGPDCIPSEGGGEDCTQPLVIIPIEKTIPHPGYDPTNNLRRDDIALVRMSYSAPYTDFIRPICLPSNDITISPPMSFTLYAAGWGAVNATVSSSNVKLHVDLPYKTLQACQSAYSSPKILELWNKQICAGGDAGKDSCKGDSGGPLMYENNRVFEVLGIVSFGPSPCGRENIPGVYTKVYEYNSWIRSHIEA